MKFKQICIIHSNLHIKTGTRFCKINSYTNACLKFLFGFELVTRESELVTRRFELVIHGFELVTRGFGLVTREFELVTRGFKLALLNFNSCF